MWKLMKRAFRGEEGQGLVEYALIIALVAIVLIAGLQLVAGGVGGIFQQIAGAL